METYIWQFYADNEVNEKIKYWVDVWEDLVDNFDKEFYGLKLVSPHILIRDIIDEIDYNQLKNDDNRSFFCTQLNTINKNDPVLKTEFRSDFCLLRKVLQNREGNLYLRQLCKTLEEKFLNGTYLKLSYNKLKIILLNNNWDKDDKENIRNISQFLIIELILKGYSLITIKEIAKHLFSKYSIYDGFIITNYPHRVERTNYQTDSGFNQGAYNEAIKAEIDNLSISARLERFLYYFFKEPSEGIFIFLIPGLKGNTEFNIGGVNFYSPNKKKYLDKMNLSSIDSNWEYFGGNNKQVYMNAAIRLPYLDQNASSIKAVEIIEKALDHLQLYFTIKTSLQIFRDRYLVIDYNKETLVKGVLKKDSWYKWNDSLAFYANGNDKNKILEFCNKLPQGLFSSIEKQSDIEQKISFSLHWYRKAEEATSFEDKLLNYWITIENIMNLKAIPNNIVLTKSKEENIISLAKELIPHIQIANFIYDIGIDLFTYLLNLLGTSCNLEPIFTLPQDVIEICQLKTDIDINFKSFFKNLELIENNIQHKLIKDKVIFAKNFYKDNSFAKEQIEKEIHQIKDDILLIYRYRNKIVHHAHYDNTMLPYFVQKAQKYTRKLLRHLMSSYSANRTQSIEEILLSNYVRINRILEMLSQKVVIDFIEIDF